MIPSIPKSFLFFLLAICLHVQQAQAVLANAWHIPAVTQSGLTEPVIGQVPMRSPFVEITPAGTFAVYTGFFKSNGAGGNQTGGTIFYRKGTTGPWSSAALGFYVNVPSDVNVQNQFWKATINLGSGGLNAGANEVIQYYIAATFSDRETTYLHGGDLDGNNLKTALQATAQASPYSYRNRPAWIFHANNRIVSGDSVAVWAKESICGPACTSPRPWA